MLTRQQYAVINQQLSFRSNPLAAVATVLIDALLLMFAFWLLRLGSVPGYLLSQIIIAIFFFHNFSLLHECGHGNGFSNKTINTFFGHYASVFCFLPYFPWKYIHQEHHKWSGALDKDPTLKEVRKIRETNKLSPLVDFAWRTWIPILGLLQHTVFWLYPMKLLMDKQMPWSKRWRTTLSVALLPTSYFLLAKGLPGYLNFRNFGLAILIYLVLVEVVNLPHHSDLPGYYLEKAGTKLPVWEQWKVTRSCYYPKFISEFIILNFNFHIEHHLFPSLLWYRLRRARELVRPLLGAEYNESQTIHWALKNRVRSAAAVYLEVPPLVHPAPAASGPEGR